MKGGDRGGPLSFFLIEAPAGPGPGLHTHPYAEIFIVQSGRGRFTLGDEEIEVPDGQIVIAQAGVPHAFTSLGSEPLRMIALQSPALMDTTWLPG